MDAIAVYNLKQKFLKDYTTFKKYLNKGYKKDYKLLLLEICVIENSDYFNQNDYEPLMTTIYE